MDDVPAFPTPENRQGHLSVEQWETVISDLNAMRRSKLPELAFVAILMVAGAWLVTIFQPPPYQSSPLGAIALIEAFLAAISTPVIIVGLRWLIVVRTARHELAGGQVVQADGELAWSRRGYGPSVASQPLRATPATLATLMPGPYRLYYLPRSRYLVAADWLGAPTPYPDVLRRLASANGFELTALAANRAGRSIRLQRVYGFVALIALLYAILMLALVASIPPFNLDPSVIFVACAIVFVALSIPARRLFADTWTGRVATATGRIRRTMQNAGTRAVYRYVVNGLAFPVSKAGYDALDERLTYQVYFTARGERLLNIEPIGEVSSAT